LGGADRIVKNSMARPQDDQDAADREFSTNATPGTVTASFPTVIAHGDTLLTDALEQAGMQPPLITRAPGSRRRTFDTARTLASGRAGSPFPFGKGCRVTTSFAASGRDEKSAPR
jgi:hypothetical protein